MADPAKPKRKTREQLEAELAATLDRHKGEIEREVSRRVAAENVMRAMQDEAKQRRAELDDVKTRLARAEADNQRMRGYIDRVQEDDVAREDLVAVGDPEGEQQLVPKRRPKHFAEPNAYLTFQCDASDRGYVQMAVGEKPRPRHWVTY